MAVAGVALVAVSVLAWILQRQLIYLPDTTTPRPPDDVETVTVVTRDGVRLDAWFLPAGPEPETTVLVANGNAGNRSHRLPLARGLVERGHAVLLLDYRGYGGNPGRPSEEGLIADVLAAHDHLAARDDVDADRIVHLGESIGSGVVAGAAVEVAPGALVLRSPFPALEDVARHHYRFLPVGMLLRDRFPTSERLSRYAGPVLVVAGADDTIVPSALSRAVARDAGAELLEVADADHNDVALLDGPEFLDTVDTFLRDAFG